MFLFHKENNHYYLMMNQSFAYDISPKRRKKTNIFNNKKHSDHSLDEMKIDMFSLLNKDNIKETPTILFQLSQREWKRWQPNSIHLSSPVVVKSSISQKYNKLHYTDIDYGSNLINESNTNIMTTTLPASDNDNNNIETNEIIINRVKGRYVLITTTMKDIQKIFTNIDVICSNGTNNSNMKSNYKPSGIVVLLFATLDNSHQHYKTSSPWNVDMYSKLKNCKPNIIKKNQQTSTHFKSKGFIASFGNKGLFGKSSESSTVGQYVSLKGNSVHDQNFIEKEATYYESLCASQGQIAIKSFRKYLPRISILISPLLQTGYMLQQNIGNINFKSTISSNEGLWQSSININAVTGIFHTERDITYTLISVPEHCSDTKRKSKNTRSDTYFLFKINDDKYISFKMVDNLSFLFSGCMLTHKQFCVDQYKTLDLNNILEPFYNISSYGNERLYRHMKESLNRVDIKNDGYTQI